MHVDSAVDDADTFIAFQDVPVLFLEFSSVVGISSGFSSGGRVFCFYLCCVEWNLLLENLSVICELLSDLERVVRKFWFAPTTSIVAAGRWVDVLVQDKRPVGN